MHRQKHAMVWIDAVGIAAAHGRDNLRLRRRAVIGSAAFAKVPAPGGGAP